MQFSSKKKPTWRKPLKVASAAHVDLDAIELGGEQQAVFEKIEQSRGHFFITGKAGTGKSVLLQYLKYKSKKNIIATAFTGVAALNIEGQTINSLFRLPWGFLDPQLIAAESLDSKSNSLMRNLETLVIDEISMVRADMMDAIDIRLRKARKSDQAFGGVQVVMFGDPYQLPPVIEDPQLQVYFTENHGGPYFFNAAVWQSEFMQILELVENFRQKDDDEFRSILNALRVDQDTESVLERLNQRAVTEAPGDDIIILATTNRIVDTINFGRLTELEGDSRIYQAVIAGDLERSAFPADEALALKEGAQVMFLKNDKMKRWVNGTIGIVHSLGEEAIKVTVDGVIYSVPKETWQKVRYRYDSADNKITSDVMSTFTQYPLRLAWAVTVHKSQGKTFSQAIVDMGHGAFAHGQAYVALSRCTTMEGVYLRRPLTRADIIIDPIVVDFMARTKVQLIG